MIFPETARSVYSRNPLSDVVCQLRFPTILQVSAAPPAAFQDRIRDKYPVLEQVATPVLPKNMPENVRVLVEASLKQNSKQFNFFTVEEPKRLVTLTENFVALTEHGYKDWETFSAELRLVEQAFREVYKPSFYSRIGLLYQNVIDRGELGLEGVPWRELLNSSIVGVLGNETCSGEKNTRVYHSETELALNDGNDSYVMLRYGLGEKKVKNKKSEVFIIAADFYTAGKVELDNAYDILKNYRVWAGNFFRWAITDHLEDALGKSPNRSGISDGID